MSLVYGWYITSLADYESIFGSLAVVMVTMSYIYLSAIVLVRDQVDIREVRAPA